MADYIEQVFGAHGYLSQRFAGYETRPGQVTLARSIDEAMRRGRHLMAEGPCGTGKGATYCVPATWHASQHGKRVVVATANIALQEQLAQKDLPTLASVLPWRVSFALLKGRNNFLCQDRLAEAQLQRGLFDDELAQQARAIRDWAETTTTGDVAELAFVPELRVWSRYSVSADDCRGEDCQFAQSCFSNAARARAEQADVVVTNYHLLFAHLAVKQATGRDVVLPAFDLLVLDEAHEAPSIAREFLGFTVSEHTFTRLAAAAATLGAPTLAGTLRHEASDLFRRLAVHRGTTPTSATPAPCRETAARLLDVLEHIRRHAVTRATGAVSDQRLRASARATARHAATATERLAEALERQEGDKVYWLEADPKGRTTVQGKPVDVSGALRVALFGSCTSVSMVSATLTTAGSFDFFRRQVGAPPDAMEVVVDSPFRFREQALLVIPEGVVDPVDPAYVEHVARVFREVLQACDGRTLGLFTSYRMLHGVRDRLASDRWRLLCQGDLPRAELVSEFRKDVRSVLLGTESFWTGIDVTGESLTAVVIDRLPFPSPEDPIIAAISRADLHAFDNTLVPLAIITLRQGVGRLIRSKSDIGVVVICDPRLATKRYGRRFLRSLPPMLSTRRLDNIPRFLEEAKRARED